MSKLPMACVALACGAVLLTSVPAAPQSKMTKDKAFAECNAQIGRGADANSRRQQMQACIKAKMRGKR